MSYNYGQYRYTGNYLDYVHREKVKVHENPDEYQWNFWFHGDENNEIDDIANFGILDAEHEAEFYDKILRLKSGYFQSQETYYLRFKVKRFPGAIQQFQIGLLNFSDETKPIAVQKIEDYTMEKGQTTTYQSFQIVFTPSQNFDSILFEYHRNGNDYHSEDPNIKWRIEQLYTEGVGRQEPIRGRHMVVKIQELGRLHNVVQLMRSNYGDLGEITKLGIQAPPGMLLGINGQQIRVGGSGIYEINSDLITVKKINTVPVEDTTPNNFKDSFFIIDFEYTPIEEQTT